MINSVTRNGFTSTYSIINGVHVFRLKGKAEDIGWSHAKLLGKNNLDSCYLKTAIQKYAERLNDLPDELRPIASSLIYDDFNLEIKDRWIKDLADGFSQGCQDIGATYSLKDIQKAYKYFDSNKFLASWLRNNLNWMLGVADITPNANIPDFDASGCSTIVSLRNRNNDRKIIFGRNQDMFPIYEYFEGDDLYDFPYDKNVSVMFVSPVDGYSYVSVLPLGLLPVAVSAMNEKGLTLAINALYTKEINDVGNDFLGLATKIMREAKNIEEAKKIVDNIYLIEGGLVTGWLFTLSDTTEPNGRAVVLELGTYDYDTRKDDGGLLFCTNHCFNNRQSKKELEINLSLRYHSTKRFQALKKKTKGQNNINLNKVAELMRSRFDPDCPNVEGVIYSPWIVSTIDQTKAVIFSPDDLRFFVANNGVAPVTEGSFMEFSFTKGISDSSISSAILGIKNFGNSGEIYRKYMQFFKHAYIDKSKAEKPKRKNENREIYVQRKADCYQAALNSLKSIYTESKYSALAAGYIAIKQIDLIPGLKLQKGVDSIPSEREEEKRKAIEAKECAKNKAKEAEDYLQEALRGNGLSNHHRHIAMLLLSFSYDIREDKYNGQKCRKELLESQQRIWPPLQEACKSWQGNIPGGISRKFFWQDRIKDLNLDFKYMDTLKYIQWEKNSLGQI